MSEQDFQTQVLEWLKHLGTKVDSIENRFDWLETCFDRLENRFDWLETKVDRLETRFDRLETKVDGLEGRFDGLETKVDRLENRFDWLETKVDWLSEDFHDFTHNQEQFNIAIWNLNTQAFEVINDIRREVLPPWRSR